MKINDYTDQAPIASGDKVIGTSGADGSTKNFDVDDMVNYVEGNITGYTGSFTSGIYTFTIVNGIITARA